MHAFGVLFYFACDCPPRLLLRSNGLCGGGVVSRAWAVLFSVSSVGKSINSSQFSVLHDCVSGRMSLVMAISDGNIDSFKMIIFIYPIICFFPKPLVMGLLNIRGALA